LFATLFKLSNLNGNGECTFALIGIGCGYVGLVTERASPRLDTSDVYGHRRGAHCAIEGWRRPDLRRASGRGAGVRSQRRANSYKSDTGEAIRFGDAIFICVGTPPREDGSADLSAIDHVAQKIAAEAQSSKLVVKRVLYRLGRRGAAPRAGGLLPRRQRFVQRCFESGIFARRNAVFDFFHPDRIVVGVDEHSAEKKMREIYGPILEHNFIAQYTRHLPIRAEAEFLVTTINSAELIKHASIRFWL